MAKQLNRTAIERDDPTVKQRQASYLPQSNPFDRPTLPTSVIESVTKSVIEPITDHPQQASPALGQAPPTSKSSVLVDFDRRTYQQLKQVAKSRGLTLRAYIRLAALDTMRHDQQTSPGSK